MWVLASGAVGFAVAAIFAGLLKLPRRVYLMVYIPVTLVFFVLFIRTESIDLAAALLHHWWWGLLGAALCSTVVIKNVLAQRPSPRSEGVDLVIDVLWPGAAYGLIDALLLTVIPVMAVFTASANAPWASSAAGKIGVGALALVSSAFVAAAYHLGYPEFRGRRVLWAVFGNVVITLAYLLTLSPLAALLSHAAMHIVAMLHGKDTTVQLPPHYEARGDEGMTFQRRTAT
jgi:hypothetical protein